MARKLSPDRSRRAGGGVVGIVGFVLATAVAGCGSSHRLAAYDFTGGTLAVVSLRQPQPEVFSELDLSLDGDNPVETALRLGSGIAREVALEGFRARLDSAAQRVDLGDRMGDRALERANDILRTRTWNTADGDPDFQVELRIRTYGFVAEDWDSRAYLAVDGTLVLVDGMTGRIIWEGDAQARDPMSATEIRTGGPAAGNVVTAFTLSRMSTDEIARALEALTDFAVDALLDGLREDLADSRP